MKILIYGTTDAGYMGARILSEKHDVTILTEAAQLPERFVNLDISFISGSGADIAALEQAEAIHADIFVACSSLDEANIVACWTVKRIADIETICFVHHMPLYHNLLLPEQNRYRTAYDIDTVIWPEQLLTQDIFRIISVPEAVDVEFFAHGRIKLFEYRIREDSEIRDRRIMDCTFPKDVLIVGVTRENKLFIPTGATVIELNDKVVFMGTDPALNRLTARFFQNNSPLRKILIIGGGSVGFLLAQQLEETGLRVTIIEHERERCVFLADNLKKSLVLHGDGTDLDLLENSAIEDIDAAICVTDNDEKNLLCSLLIKQISTCRIITRASNANTAVLFDRVGIDVVVSPQDAALKDLLNHVQARAIDVLALIEGGQGEVVRLTVPAGFERRKVADLCFKARAVIGVIQRGRQFIIPNGETIVQPGDRLKIFTMSTDVDVIRAMFSA
ncbi:MAG TPA: Trk system potassium transporter TrkA [Desulfofustis sp.]|jgi:trk system potassium uptake protein TrkA|nr:Trk system potassium transporter TrkA [Desulfofustis sp. PB-SRB1]HBH29788.1 Trk system potassium transporter TrkA [Desulfofustis sp.]HBH32731.1 Trk system potassium transporter TrkA [Desulfofustis sp.]